MDNITTGDVTLVLSIIMAALAVFQLINILLGKAVEAQVIDYEESTDYDPGTDTAETNVFPIYRYFYDGNWHTHRSKFGLLFTWIRKDYNTIYISKRGWVFEKEGVILTLIGAFILFMIP